METHADTRRQHYRLGGYVKLGNQSLEKQPYMDVVVQLKGNLADTELSDLLEVLHVGSKTGILDIRYDTPTYNSSFAFSNGLIGRVRSPFAAKISDIMLDLGVSPEQIERLRVSQKRDAGLSKQTLINEHQDVPHELVLRALRRRLEMALMPIYDLRKAVFDFYTGKPENFIEPGIDPRSLSLDVARKRDELGRYGKELLEFSPHERFVINEAHMDLSVHMQTFGLYEWRVLQCFFQAQTLEHVAVEARLVWDELLISIGSLLDRELLIHLPS